METKTLQQQLADLIQKFGEEKTFSFEVATAEDYGYGRGSR